MDSISTNNPPRRTRFFRCKYCSATFGLGNELITHKKNHHMGQIIAERKQRTEGIDFTDSTSTVSLPKHSCITDDTTNATDETSGAAAATVDPVSLSRRNDGMDSTGISSDTVSSPEMDSNANFNDQLIEEINANESESAEKCQDSVHQLPPCYVVVTPLDQFAIAQESRRILRRKRRSHFGLPSFPCSVCKQRFPLVSLRRRHMLIHHGKGKVKETLRDSKIKTKTSSTFRSKRSCRVSDCTFTTWHVDAYYRHNAYHKFRGPIKCPLCIASFSTSAGRLTHVSRVHPGTAVIEQCQYKPKNKKPQKNPTHIATWPYKSMSLTQPTLPYQQETPDGDNVAGGFPCNKCTAVLKSSTALNYHFGKVHGKSSWCKCDYCPYESFGTFVCRHMTRLHTNKYGSQFACHYCGASCPTKWFLERHIAVLHGNSMINGRDTVTRTYSELLEERKKRKVKTAHVCGHCPYSNIDLNKVKQHILNSHTVKRHYQCEHCSASYSIPLGLVKHRKIHASEPTKVSRLPILARVSKSNVSSTPVTNTASKQQDSDTDPEDPNECRICDVTLFRGGLERHKLGNLHCHNENIYRRQKGLPVTSKPVRKLNAGKNSCKICKIRFHGRSNLEIHYEIRHGTTSQPKLYARKKKLEKSNHMSKMLRQRSSDELKDSHRVDKGFEAGNDFFRSTHVPVSQAVTSCDTAPPERVNKVIVTQHSKFGVKTTLVRLQ